jgi:RHS repeat-associated protein
MDSSVPLRDLIKRDIHFIFISGGSMKRVYAVHPFGICILLSTLFISSLFAKPAAGGQQPNDEWVVFGETRFDGKTGTAKTYTQKFTVPILKPQSFNLQLVNGDGNGKNRVTNATVKLNGVTIISPTECTQQTASLTKEVTVQSSNTLQITVNGKTGSYIKITCSKHLFPIHPIVECVENNGNGTYTAHFGYSNDNTYPVTVPVGLLNLFLPLPINRGQPTVFQPGRQQNVFSVVFNGKPLIWEVRGRIITATNNPSLACGGVDTIPPAMSITSPVDGMITSASSVQVSGTASDASPVTVTINGSAVTVDASGSFTGTVTLTEGLNTITIIARDAAGNQTTVTRKVTKDSIPPTMIVTTPKDSTITNQTSITLSGTVTDVSAATLMVNGSPVQVGTNGAFSSQLALVEGLNTITVVATDATGNKTTVTRKVRRDTQSPIVSLASPIDSVLTNQLRVTVSGTVLDSTAVMVNVKVGSGTSFQLQVGTDGTFAGEVSLVEGTNTITVVATDAAGNITTISRLAIRDTQSPIVNLTSPIDSLFTNQLSVIVSGTVIDSTAVTLTINGITVLVGTDGTFSSQLALVEGMNTITVMAVDAATNQSTEIRHVSVLTIPPVLIITAPIDSVITNIAQITVQGTVSSQFPVTLTVNGTPVSVGFDSTFSTQVNLQEGINTITVIATNSVGSATTVTRTIWYDTQTPQLTLISLEDGMVTKQSNLLIQGSVSDLTTVIVTVNGLPATIHPDGTFTYQLTLVEGKNTITFVATDAVGNHLEVVRTIILDTKVPVLSIASLANNVQTTDSIVAVLGSVGDSTNITLTVNGVAQTLSADGGFSTSVFLSYGSNIITFVAADQAGNTLTATRTITRVPLLPDPVTVAPTLDTTVVTLVMDATEFLYTGADPIQKGVASGTINKLHVTVLRGKVLDKDLLPLSGAKVTILGNPEFGYTFSRSDGMYDIVVNGGGEVKVNFAKIGYLPAQRQVTACWATYANVDDAVLLQLDTAVHSVDFTQPEIVQGTPATDSLGTRRPTLFFNQGTQAKLVFQAYNYKIIGGCYSPRYFPNNPIPDKIIPIPIDSLVSLGSVNVRVMEYTVGPNAELLIPANLPQTVAYTFVVELTADEMLSTGARDVRFNQPVSLYLENVMNFPVGLTVPMGCFNREKGVWETSDNGRVIKILDATGGIAAIDYNGDGIAEPADTLVTRGISLIEQQYLATTYSAGQSIWRAEITHLGTYAGGFGMITSNAAYPQNPLPDRYAKVDRDNIVAGSVIGVQNQTLGESVPITNTPITMNYKSDRVFGRREAYCLDIPLTGKTIPEGMSKITLEIEIVGRKYDSTFVPQPNLTHHFEWDGIDAYGRRVQGQQNILTTISYCYHAQYTLPPDVHHCFATPSGQIMEQYIAARNEIKRTQIWEGKIGAFDILSLGIGGWSLSLHHGYDCVGKILYKGTGEVRSANVMDNVINTIAGLPNGPNYNPCSMDFEGVQAAKSPLNTYNSAPQFGVDGSLYFTDGMHIRKIDTTGIISTFAGLIGVCGNGLTDTATGIMANCASFSTAGGLAQGPDGSWYVSEWLKHVIWKISPDGEFTRFAGVHYDNSDSFGHNGRFGGDGGPALDAYFSRPVPIAFGKDGCLYVGDTFNYRIRKISPDGIITTVAGTGVQGYSGDGGPAILCNMGEARGLTVAPDGSILFCDIAGGYRIRRITPDGIIRTFAGNGNGSYITGDGGPAINASVAWSDDITVAKDGTVFLNSNQNVRGVSTDGYIKTVVGGGNTYWVENGPATSSALGYYPKINVGPDNNLYVADGNRIFKVTPPLPGITLSEILIASEDGSERYVFTYSGRHLRTLDALTGVTKYSFGYNSRYKLVTITDIDSLVTRIERDSSRQTDGGQADVATAIISPYGVRTQLNLDSLGYLLQAVNPASESNQFTYTSGGLMTSKTDARSNTYHYEYDSLGYLTRDLDPVGGYTNITRTYDPDSIRAGTSGYTVTAVTAMGKTTKYRAEKLPTGVRRFINTDANGLKTITVDSTDGSSYTITPDGMNRPAQEKPDPRFGMQSPLVNATAKTPGGLQSNVNQFRTITQMTGTAVTGLRDSISANGKPLKIDYDGNARVLTKTSPEGRKTYSFFDAKGRVVKDSVPGLVAIIYKFDNKGRKIEDNQGGRKTTYEYDSLGRQSKITNAYGRSVQLHFDLGDRLVKTILPDSSEVLFAYDRNENMLSLKPPDKPAHEFEYSMVDLETSYTPPFAGDSARSTAHLYNLDKEVWKVSRPDSLNVTLEYGGQGSLAGVPKKIYFDRGMLTNLCDTLKGQQIGVVSSNGDTLRFVYDGTLVKEVTWSGPNTVSSVKGSVAFSYNNDQKVITETLLPAIGMADSVNLQYDKDGMLTSVGVMKLKYGQSNTLLLSDTVGNIITNYVFDTFGATISKEVRFDAMTLFRVEYVRDSLSRIKERQENVYGMSTKYGYSYDGMGRLEKVWKNDTLITEYQYDANGNRLTKITPTDTVQGIYDAQDRLLAYSTFKYLYTQNGDLMMKVDTLSGDTTRYSYDALANLRSVTLSNGTLIEYLVDGSGRRVGKKINGSVTQKWIYSSDLKILAELDSANNIVSRFVYTSSDNIPEYMVRSGIVYRLIIDHVGSLRSVVNTSTGAIVERIDYNEYGIVLNDTNASFTPFGFAGGLFDCQTKLTRFGSRDYEPELGRWITKDPIGFNGNSFNLYSYVNNEPINLSDPKGLYEGAGHFSMTIEATQWRGYSTTDAIGLAQGSRDVDSYEHSQETTWDYTPLHAMGAMGNTDRRIAYLATANWVETNYYLAIMDKIGYGDMDSYYREMGYALHAVQDQWCPSHNFQEWRGGFDMYKYHWIDLPQINRDKAIESSILLLQGNIGAAMRHY